MQVCWLLHSSLNKKHHGTFRTVFAGLSSHEPSLTACPKATVGTLEILTSAEAAEALALERWEGEFQAENQNQA